MITNTGKADKRQTQPYALVLDNYFLSDITDYGIDYRIVMTDIKQSW